jgi:molybdopterin/thiamine biosynthesis adenylyltransferase
MSADRYSRRSFLGSDAEERISDCTVGIVGLGGGGSHIVQRFAHIGFQDHVIYDDDRVEESNLNRLVGARSSDNPRQPGRKVAVTKPTILVATWGDGLFAVTGDART